MIYGSVCSGIEAATIAWHPLGWKAAFYSEIDKFPSAVLAHHYPSVPNFGDFTTIKPEQHDAIDLLVGGTPCQSFSIAGLRGGLGDDRGNLALEYLRLADRARPRWLVWENVPGVLSSGGGRDFGSILGGMGELGYGVAYRVLDAQYCRVGGFWRAVPQRRRRVFVVGYLGDWRRAAAVLFERASLLGDSAPSRQAGEGIAPTISARTKGGGGLGKDFDCDGGLIAGTLQNSGKAAGSATQQDAESGLLVAHSLRADGFDASEDGTGRGTPLIPIDMRQASRGEKMTNNRSEGSSGGAPGTGIGKDGDPSPTIASSHIPAIAYNITPSNSNKDYNAREATYAQAVTAQGGAPSARGGDVIAFDCKASGQSGFGVGEIASTMRAMGHSDSHQNGGGHQAVAIQERAVCENPMAGPDGIGVRDDGAAYTIEARMVPQAVQTGWAVRRLTPVECERLQGFPDGYTDIPWRGKTAPDGPRYKALGNSMAVNVMRWIGTRIEMVETLSRTIAA